MDPDAYLKKHHLLTYVEDAVCLLLARKDEDPKTKPFQLLAGYFKSVLDDSQVVFREYNFISSTPRNRKAFVRLIWQTYNGVPEAREPMRLAELHSLVRLLCADFPLGETEKVALHEHSGAGGILSFPDFMYTFQITFYFDCFLGHLKSMLPGLLTGAYIPPLYGQFTAVVVPLPPAPNNTSSNSPSSTSKSIHGVETEANEAKVCSRTVEGGVFLEAALGLCRRMGEREPGQSYPSQEALKEVLSGVEQLSLNEFVVKLSLSETINREIGVLPVCKRI